MLFLNKYSVDILYALIEILNDYDYYGHNEITFKILFIVYKLILIFLVNYT